MKHRCSALTKSGAACTMPPVYGTPLCWTHSPEVAARRAAARQEGGRRNRAPYGVPLPDGSVSLRTAEAIATEVERVYHDTLMQANGALRSRSLAAVLSLALRVLETSELEERITALEARARMRRA